MANFRAERLLIRINGSIEGFDPNFGIDVVEFAHLMGNDHGTYERDPLDSFAFAPFDRPRWFSAAKGLKMIRGFIDEIELKLTGAIKLEKSKLETELFVLRAVENRLDTIDVRDLKFYFLIKDLEP